MNWLTLIYQHLRRQRSAKFLLIFSLCTLTVAGVVWACADAGEDDYSAFSPEYFVAKEYSPFFYDSYTTYYNAFETEYADDSNTRYNNQNVNEWYDYLNHSLSRDSIKALLFSSTSKSLDSVYRHLSNNSTGSKKLTNAQASNFFNYLLLAKSCESFTVRDQAVYWDKPAPVQVPTELEAALTDAFQKTTDVFIKERLWFQLVRYAYFKDAFTKDSLTINAQTPELFDKYKLKFPHNLFYYRTLGYVGGYYYHHKSYARANYIYSLCYNYNYDMKIPSKWSFRPQNESDWKATLNLAQSAEEKITLWHLLGMEYDPLRAIREIVLLNPKSDKLDLLLSRLVNVRENALAEDIKSDSAKLEVKTEIKLVDSIALKNNTSKPYYWNLAAGYLNYLSKNYTTAENFYSIAKSQFPSGDRALAAQGKLLDLLLCVGSLKRTDGHIETRLTEPLNWLANLRDGKDSVKYLRYQWPLGQCKTKLTALYHQQHDPVKELCYTNSTAFYLDSVRVEKLKFLLRKPKKTPYEQVLLRYYLLKIEDIYYYQAAIEVYKENLPKAIAYMRQATGRNNSILPANPFNGRLIDCHDCDQAVKQKNSFTSLSFLLRIETMQNNLKAGKDKFQNAYLLGNAYYNITHYGNDRGFYQSPILGGDATQPSDIFKPFRKWLASSKIAEKYYLIARNNASTAEQKARCTFMAAKCEHNTYYTTAFNKAEETNSYGIENILPPAGKYFAELKSHYRNTSFTKEVLEECGFFKQYIKVNK